MLARYRFSGPNRKSILRSLLALASENESERPLQMTTRLSTGSRHSISAGAGVTMDHAAESKSLDRAGNAPKAWSAKTLAARNKAVSNVRHAYFHWLDPVENEYVRSMMRKLAVQE